MSELIDFVAAWPHLEHSFRIDPHILCRGSWNGEHFWFLVTDDNWNGWFVTQYPHRFSPGQLEAVISLIKATGHRGSPMFRFDYQDLTGIVRAVFQLPIANEPRWEDDVRVATNTLQQQWAMLLPFLRRIEAGEGVDEMINEARSCFARTVRVIDVNEAVRAS